MRKVLALNRLHSRLLNIDRGCSIRRQSGLSNWFQDVFRTGSFQPPNPILSKSGLPEFSRILPYHLESATKTAVRQYAVELAELEVSLSSAVGNEDDLKNTRDLFNKIDQIEAPIVQIIEVARLFTKLASLPDQQEEWQRAAETARKIIDNKIQPYTQSRIVFEKLKDMANGTDGNDFPLHIRMAFEKEGVNLPVQDDGDDDFNRIKTISDQLKVLEKELETISSYKEASKAARLNTVKCMYNVIGLKNLQAQQLSYPTVTSMAMAAHNNMATSKEEILKVQNSVAQFLKPYLPEVEFTLDQDAGAFLPNSKSNGPTESEKEVWRAKQSIKKLIFLDGALQGLSDFCDSIFGIKVVEEKNNSSVLGWNKNVRIFHLLNKEDASELGSIYLDPFYDPYWRSETNNVVMTRLFSQRQNQTDLPIAVIGLSISPTWDDVPTPLTWKDFQDLLYQFGKALQLILAQKGKQNSPVVQPADMSEFLATFMLLWINNDGFLQRIAQLSQDQFTFQPELMKVLRDDLKRQKASDLMQVIFLSTLELTVFTDFDPRGDETLVSLQQRLAEQYIPHDIPDSSDLSPLVEIFRGKAVSPRISAYSPLWSEILSSMAYEKFQTTDLRERDAVQKLGLGIRDLVSDDQDCKRKAIEKLFEKQISSDSMKSVHNF